MIRVALVEDQALVRAGIKSLLQLCEDIEVVAEAADGEEGIQAVRNSRPDVLLLDVRMPRKDGLDVLTALSESDELPPTILLTTFDDDEILIAAVRSGARGYLLKDVLLEDLVDAIRVVASGGTVVRPAITEQVLRRLTHLRAPISPRFPPPPMTTRETEVLRLLAGGYSNREIAEALGTSDGTVKNHVSHILAKLGVRDRTRAVLKAIDLGYL